MVIFSGPKWGMGLQDHMIPLRLVFQGISVLFSIMALPFTFPPRLREDFIFCTFSVVIIVCRSFRWWPFWPVYARYHLVVLFGIDLIITDVDYLSMCFYLLFYILWEQFTSSMWLLESWPCLEFFSVIYPRTFLEGRCHLPALLDCHLQALSDLWLLWAL